MQRTTQGKERKTGLTSVIFTVIINHQHDLPLEDIVVFEAAADARYVLVGLHLLQLAG
jgi:hypothetical protein